MTILRWFAVILFAGMPTIALAQDAKALTARIDRLLADAWHKAKIEPSKRTSDGEFLRRVMLDIAGRIPTAQESQQFLADTSADRRDRAIVRLLDSPGYARHWANVWRRQLLPQADTPQFARFAADFEFSLNEQLGANSAYDKICRSVLVSEPKAGGRQEVAQIFATVAQNKPEAMAANSARVFLGVNLDCAQCHNHPFARWSKDQFWEFAAFFATLKPATDTLPARFELAIPESKKTAAPKLFVKDAIRWPEKLDRNSSRVVVANWITDRGNPFFARNAVNRVWAQLLGRGLIEPLDDLSDTNPASQPELMSELSQAFVASGFDLKYLIRAIVATKAYQASSAGQDRDADPGLFASMNVRGLSGEQLFDSLRIASGLPLIVGDDDAMGPQKKNARKAFLAQFNDARPSTAQRSILQALELMNGPIAEKATNSKTVVTIAESPFLDATGRINQVYLTVLSRMPTESETQTWHSLVDTEDAQTRRRVLRDLFWVLMNSAEFSVNH